MIVANMRSYDYYTFGELNAYGQPQLSKEPVGKVKLSIYTTSENVQANVNYTNANYIALTHDKNINDTYLIQYGEERLKVLYTAKLGRFIQVFLAKVN
jgi:hypothetical protein